MIINTNPAMEDINTSSYLAFVGNVNADMVDAALGKNNENGIKGVGKALAMYAKYKDSTLDIASAFPNLISCDTLADVCEKAMQEVTNCSDIYELISSSEYGVSIMYSEGISLGRINALLSNPKSSLDEIWTDNDCLVELYNKWEQFNSLNLYLSEAVCNSLQNSSAKQTASASAAYKNAATAYSSPCLIVWCRQVTNGEIQNINGGYLPDGSAFNGVGGGQPKAIMAKQATRLAASSGTYAVGITVDYIPITL